jgi:hypothetical protein
MNDRDKTTENLIMSTRANKVAAKKKSVKKKVTEKSSSSPSSGTPSAIVASSPTDQVDKAFTGNKDRSDKEPQSTRSKKQPSSNDTSKETIIYLKSNRVWPD